MAPRKRAALRLLDFIVTHSAPVRCACEQALRPARSRAR
jgi:hypothetical protein